MARGAVPFQSKTGHVAILTSSGGGAHLSTAAALRERLGQGELGPVPVKIAIRDVVREWMWPVGPLGTAAWNQAMVRDKLGNLRRLMSLQTMADVLYWPIVFVRSFWMLWRSPIDLVLDCQVMGLHALLAAAAVISKLQGREVRIVKVLTEPTHALLPQYFDPIRRLPKRYRARLDLWAGPPLCEPQESASAFFERVVGGCLRQVVTDLGYPVRPEFGEVAHHKENELWFSATGTDELTWLRDRFYLAPRFDADSNRFAMKFPEDTKAITIMLGSQGADTATLAYVEKILSNWDDPRVAILVCYGSFEAKSHTLVPALATLRRRIASRSKLVPLSRQPARVIAHLMRESRVVIVRPGGATAMELLSTGRAVAFVHSASTKEGLEAGLLVHELGNFKYLKAFYGPGARPVTPASVVAELKKILEVQTRGTPGNHTRSKRSAPEAGESL